MSLPTFNEAMSGLHWNWGIGASLLGPYLDANSLAACCAVSKDFSKHFLPILWSNPLKITKSKQKPFLKTVMFMHTARGASQELRSFVRTLDLGSFYRDVRKAIITEQCDETFDDIWFFTRAQLFPALQFAVMDKTPHSYLSPMETTWPTTNMRRHYDRTERTRERRQNGSTNESDPSSVTSDEQRTHHHRVDKIAPLLFSAYGCRESEGRNLVEDLYSSNLVFLDLSYTRPNTTKGILQSATMGSPNLRVLKLRGLRIGDYEFSKFTQTYNGKLWSLDLTDNLLTDVTVRDLVNGLFMLDNISPKPASIILPDQDMFEAVPGYRRDAQAESFKTTTSLRPDCADAFIKYIENHSSFPSIYEQFLDGQDPLLRQTGLTHLHISRNRLTSIGVTALLFNNRLQVLDVGSVEGLNPDGSRPNYTPYTIAYQQLNLNSTWAVSSAACSRMEVLRIHHSFVTHVPTLINAESQNNCFTLELLKKAEHSASQSRPAGAGLREYHIFSPLQNHRITKLTLTDIPTVSYGLTIERLIEFLEQCRIQEEQLNEARKYTERSRRTPQLLPGLRTLRLEFLPQGRSLRSPDLGGSVSGDRDADTFLASSEGDFSFFDDPNTMSSVSRRGSVATTMSIGGTGSATPTSRKGSMMGGAMLKRAISTLSKSESSSSGPAAPEEPEEPPAYAAEVKYVAEELKKYRAKKEGKWSGNLVLVFPSAVRRN